MADKSTQEKYTTDIVYQVVITHSNYNIDNLVKKIGFDFTISEAKKGLSRYELEKLEYHLEMSASFESFIRMANVSKFPLQVGTRLYNSNYEITAEISNFAYDFDFLRREVIFKIFLNIVGHGNNI